jgi:23S rRNA pseudouridine1911/1915/1917 synthase
MTEADKDGGRRIERIVARGVGGVRLDVYLAGSVADLSRSRAKTLIEDGRVTVDGAEIREPRRSVKAGDIVTVELPPPVPAKPQGETIPLDVVYEDSDLLVIDKPVGLVVHPAAGNQSGTLVNALIAHCGNSLSGIGGVARPGIVHRLDKDTSGLMVVAKNDRAHRDLSEQFADHGRTGPLERAYLALVWGAPERAEGTIEASLGRSIRNREKIEVKREGGREALTHYRVIERFGPKSKPVASLVECRLETGRTHQIRVHMAAIGHPLVGDRTYGAGFATKAALAGPAARTLIDGLRHQALYAYLLAFRHPATGETMYFEHVLPDFLSGLIDALRVSGT